MKHSEKQIIEAFRQAVQEVDNKKLGEVSPTTSIDELGLDSVVTMEVIGVLEEKLGVHFPDEDLATLRTIGDLTGLVARLS